MKRLGRFLLLAGIALVFLVVAGLLSGDLWELPRLVRQVGEEQVREHDLEAQAAVVAAKKEVRKRVAREVIAGRLSLAQGAARLRDISLADPGFQLGFFRMLCPGATDEERYCRGVITWARMSLPAEPERARAAADKMEAELTELLRRGPLHLPGAHPPDKPGGKEADPG
jgi:hypothetical protein